MLPMSGCTHGSGDGVHCTPGLQVRFESAVPSFRQSLIVVVNSVRARASLPETGGFTAGDGAQV